VGRIGRRLSSIDIVDQSTYQVLDQTGAALFTNNFIPNPDTASPQPDSLNREIRQSKTGHLEKTEICIRLQPSIPPAG
jgi:hypothetical protein